MPTTISSRDLRKAAEIKDQIESLEAQLQKLLNGQGLSEEQARGGRKGKMSAAGRARIIAAQKARWAKLRATSSPIQKAKGGKRKMSAAVRAKITAAAKTRWAKAKAAGKRAL